LKKRTLTAEEYEYVFSRTPRLCLDFVIVCEGKILLTKRSMRPYKHTWHFPGGRVMFKETVGEATARIIGNELGVKLVAKPRLIGYAEFMREGKDLHSISLVFTFDLPADIVSRIKTDVQADGYKFFSEPPARMHPVHRKFAEEHDLFRNANR